MTRTRLSIDTFFVGLLAGIVYRGRRAVSLRGDRFDRIVAAVVDSLRAKYPPEMLDLRFRVQPHNIHGYSITVRDAIAAATQTDLVSLDNPKYQDMRFKIDRDEAEEILERTPLGKEVFLELADEFLRMYDGGEVKDVVAAA
jgi:hypothetical protein